MSRSLKIVSFLILLFFPEIISAAENNAKDVSANKSETVLQRIQKIPFTPWKVNNIPDFDTYGGEWVANQEGVLTGKGGHGGRLVPIVKNMPEMKSGEVSVDIFIPVAQDGYSGLCFKVSKNSTGADAFNGYEVGFNPKRKHIMFGAHRWNFKPITQKPCQIPVGKWFTLRVVFQEETFDVWLEGQKMFTWQEKNMSPDDPLRSGSIAMRCWGYEIRFRNLKWRLLAGPNQPEANWTSLPYLPQEKKQLLWPEQFDTEELDPFLVLLRKPLTRPNSVGNDLWQSRPTGPGCAIRLVNPAKPKEPVRTVFEDPNGSIYDMNLSYDAKTVWFSYRPQNGTHWSIWKVNVDGTGLKQITNGPFFDVSPCELPDGDIVFVSTRRFGHTVCQPGPSSNLFRMKPDGSDIRCISMNTLSDMSPQVLPDGRILFTRWEYIDRDLTYRQSLWTQNPDGTAYQLFFGNTVRDPGTFWQARPLPDGGSSKVVATFAPHHGYPQGAIGIIDRSLGVEGEKGKSFKWISREFPVIRDTSYEFSWRDPFPLADDLFLCSFGSDSPTVFADDGNHRSRYRIWLLDGEGDKRMIYEDQQLGCYCPIPLVERDRPPVLPNRSDSRHDTAMFRPTLTQSQRFYLPGMENNWNIPELKENEKGEPAAVVVLTNVYNGIEPVIKKGSVKSIRIMEQVRKTEDLRHRAYDQSPVMSYGTYYAKRNWGTVPVEEDGSAHFYAPALREIYFQILDEEGRELHRMTSGVQFMPGESTSCLGCHEPRDTLPGTANTVSRRPLAASRAPDLPKLPTWMNDLPAKRTNPYLDAGIVDYPSVVQPVLDQYCISCHQGENPDGGYDLTGDRTRFFSVSYDNLLGRSRSYRQHNMATGEMFPDQAEKGKPLVHFYWLLFTPTAVHQPFQSGTFASRLPDYFSKEHCKQDIPLEAKQRVYLWMDANVPYYGTYVHARPTAAGRRDRWTSLDGNSPADWMKSTVLPYFDKNCSSCHGNLYGGNKELPGVMDSTSINWVGRYAWINLTHPSNSSLLTAHLAKAAGGRGIPTHPDKPESVLFKDKNNVDYQTLLNALETAKSETAKLPEADSPGFRNARAEP